MEIKKIQEVEGYAEGFRVITVGSGAPHYDPERRSACTVVYYKDKSFIVDMGYGSGLRLHESGLDQSKMTNVLLTHMHMDHTYDFGYFILMNWGRQECPLNVVGPAGIQELVEHYKKFYHRQVSRGADTEIHFTEVVGGESFEIDGVQITTLHVPHVEYNVAYRFDADGHSVVVSGDLECSEEFVAFSKGADIVVLDANNADSVMIDEMLGSMEGRGFSPEQIAERRANPWKGAHAPIEDLAKMAEDAGAKIAVMTHMTRGAYLDKLMEKTAQNFSGEIVLAEDLLSITL